MFNQQQYVNAFIKQNYKSIKIRIRNDNKVLLNKLDNVQNVNKYITELILNDIYQHRVYNFIDNSVEIDFPITKTMQDLVDKAEEADLLNDYGLYMNIADAIDSQGKKETTHHIIRETQWKKLIRRYCL